jgi:hypothetical protein
MPAQRRTIVKVGFNQLTQAFWRAAFVQMNEQLLKSLNMRVHIGVDHALLDMTGDDLHYIMAQYEPSTIMAKSSLGFIAVDESFFGPVGSRIVRRT